MKGLRRLGLAVLIALVATGCGPGLASFRQHPAMIEELQAKPRIAMLPADVSVVELDLYGDYRRLVEIEEPLKAALESAMAERLKMRGFDLRPTRLEEAEVGDDAGIRFDYTRLRLDYNHLTYRVYRKELDEAGARGVRAAMGPLVNRFADRADADVLLFSTVAGFVKSEGMRQKDGFFTLIAALLGSYRPSPVAAAIFEIGLVDGTSGELLWVDRSGAVFFREIEARFLVDESLKNFKGLHNPPADQNPPTPEPQPEPESEGVSASSNAG